ncbi:MAG: hypothetical protein U5K77_00230 [Candidatus Saccharibacteria bacterium]|nr:hypothetical protein [Candidatus Saccharibacteria bacterium]
MELTRKSIQTLHKRTSAGPKLSIYIPTHPKSNSASINEDKTRLKNALKAIENDPKFDKHAHKNILKPLHDVLDDTQFWKHQAVGLALFADANGFEFMHLPLEPTEATYIDKEFVISPLIIMHSIATGFYVLDVNLSRVRLLKSAHGTLHEIEDAQLPESFQDRLANMEYSYELQHQGAPKDSTGSRGDFHGHEPDEAIADDIIKYLRDVARATDAYLSGHDKPLLLAGTENRVGNLHKFIHYKHTLPHALTGNFESHTPQMLHDAATEIIQQHQQHQREELVQNLLASGPEHVVMGHSEITEAAAADRVQRLYLPIFRNTADNVRTGDVHSIVLQLPKAISELESMIRSVINQAGEVIAVEVDAYKELAQPKALCRF